MKLKDGKEKIKFLNATNLQTELENFTKGMSVTKGSFEIIVNSCTLEDIEWNHMDQLHRPTIHNTYEKGMRIATGENFAVSLTQWKRWPFFITVTDVYVAKGLFYQSLTLAGILFVHSIIRMQQIDDTVKLIDEWYIASHRLFKFMHGPLNRKLYKLNARLQQEDEQIRQGRFDLRKKGYLFKTDLPNYYNANLLASNTIYPSMGPEENFSLANVGTEPIIKQSESMEFIVKKKNTDSDNYLIWSSVCPHEGGPLAQGKLCDLKITCPWHGLTFLAAEISKESPEATKHGFCYRLLEDKVYVTSFDTVRNEKSKIKML